MAAGAIPPPQFFERAVVSARSSGQIRSGLFASGERHCQEHPKTQFRRSCVWTAVAPRPEHLAIGHRRRIFEQMANTSSAKKATRKIARRTIINKSRRTQMRGAVRIVEEAIKTGDRDAALKAMARAEPELMQAAQRNIIHRNNASRKVSRLAHQIAKLAK
jgi:small subunit ribosomal protein S20